MNRHLLLTIAIWIVLALMPLLLDVWALAMYGQLLVYGLAAMSLAFIWGEIGLVCFGQALFFGTGAYVMALTSKGMIPGVPDAPWLGLFLGVVGGALAGGVVGGILFFGKGLKSAYFGIVTIAAAVIAERLMTNWRYAGGFNGLLDVPPLPLPFGTDSLEPLPGYLLILGFAMLGWLVLLALQRTPFGTILRGIRCDERRMQSLGFSVPIWKTAGLAISGGVAGLAGALFAAQFSFVSPAVVGLALSTEILIWAAVGGKAALMAAFLGAIGVKWTESVLSETIGNYWLLVIGLAFVAVIVVFPQGILGRVLDLRAPRRLHGGNQR